MPKLKKATKKNGGLRKDVANKIYDILVKCCGAPDVRTAGPRHSFIANQTSGFVTEWRFGGDMGFGGKFWRNEGMWYVNCYSEDKTSGKNKAIQKVNKELAELKAQYEGY